MHFSQTILIRCGDDNYTTGYSLAPGLERILMLENARVHFEPGGGFGSALEFLFEDAQRLWVRRIEIAEHAGVTKIILVDHTPCTACELLFGKMTPEDEYQKHLEAIRAAQTFFGVYAPKMQFIAYIQKGDQVERII